MLETGKLKMAGLWYRTTPAACRRPIPHTVRAAIVRVCNWHLSFWPLAETID